MFKFKRCWFERFDEEEMLGEEINEEEIFNGVLSHSQQHGKWPDSHG